MNANLIVKPLLAVAFFAIMVGLLSQTLPVAVDYFLGVSDKTVMNSFQEAIFARTTSKLIALVVTLVSFGIGGWLISDWWEYDVPPTWLGYWWRRFRLRRGRRTRRHSTWPPPLIRD